MSQIDLSIVIPAYNEGERIGATLDRVLEYLKKKELEAEIIVVDDGSRDETRQVAARKLNGCPFQILANEVNRGKGHAVRRGVLAASGRIILFSDADLSTPIEELEKMLAGIREGFDIVIGSRSIAASQVEVHQNWLRQAMGKIFNQIAQALSFQGIHDSQCGFKAFQREVAHAVFSRQKLDGFCFDAEVLFLAQKMGYRIKEVGVVWRNSPKSKVRIVRDSLRMLADLFRIRLLHFGEAYSHGR